MEHNEKTEVAHWEDAWSARPRMSFPSGIDIGTRNVLKLLKKYLRPQMRYLEVGCAPGKIMAWVAREINARVHGIDYSPTGVEQTRWLCGGLGIEVDVRCEDALNNTFEKASFDLVFSCGLIEHFEDPKPMVAAHAELLAPGGTAVIAIPNYSGLYLKLQKWCDQDNLAIHNLDIMNEQAMYQLAPEGDEFEVRTFSFGKFSPWLISLPSKLGKAGLLFSWGLNFMACLQPVDIKRICPLIVLEIKKL